MKQPILSSMYNTSERRLQPMMQLYDSNRQRLYANGQERTAFLNAAQHQLPHIRIFCRTLVFTGCRISEALALAPSAVQPASATITFETLKRRKRGVMREVPIPSELALEREAISLPEQSFIWQLDGVPINRSTAYRWIKQVMKEAGIKGAMASPKGLRHGYGIHTILCGVPLTMLQNWMGHAAISTTSIHASTIGKEEREIAGWMWHD
ncbi:tyrosine-type recombinase/integrase [Litoreibacter sp.]|nr:tyrosine-type recombinase/integrase [Litoreibacter sp.]